MSVPLKSQTLNTTLTSKNTLSVEEMELYELAGLAGITLDPQVFKIILDLLKWNVTPQAVLQMLNSMCCGRKKKTASVDQPVTRDVDPAQLGHSGRQKTVSRTRQGSASRRSETKR